jgi:hypothetical protein
MKFSVTGAFARVLGIGGSAGVSSAWPWAIGVTAISAASASGAQRSRRTAVLRASGFFMDEERWCKVMITRSK